MAARLALILLLLVAPPGARAASPPETATPADAVPSHAVVFMYHRFGEGDYPTTNVRPEQFQAHLDHLSRAGYRVWPLERIVAERAAGRPLPDRVVAITVDDAYRSVYTEAFPRLKARGWPFTVFVATDAVDAGSPGLLTWDEMRRMAKDGATFANHSATHDHLIHRRSGEDRAAWAARVRADLARARGRLEAELGRAPDLFAYPYGEYDPDLAALVRGMGYTPFGQQSGAVGPHSDPAALPRFPMAEAYAGLDDFRLKAASLPLPVTAAAPESPVLADANPPRLELTVEPADLRPDALACYASAGGPAVVTWLDRAAGRLAVTASGPLPAGRSRYNCTAPSRAAPRRYYWYSHLWIRPPG